MLQKLTLLFPLWMLIAAILALFNPAWFTSINQGSTVVFILAFVMLCMGLTLTIDDFRRIGRMPKAVATGFFGQYTIMPALAWEIAMLLDLPVHFAVGLILVGCCPGGTASNLISYIAKADVALSVVMTICSTLAAIILTPLLTKLFAGTLVPVDTWMLFKQTLQVVILPVALGITLNHWIPNAVQRVIPFAPLLAVIGVCMICATVFAGQAEGIRNYIGELILATALLHTGGFFLGYSLAKLSNHDERSMRTISIEVGMQNSGLAIVLSKQAFPLLPLAPVIGAISVLMHSLLGSLLAVIWRSHKS